MTAFLIYAIARGGGGFLLAIRSWQESRNLASAGAHLIADVSAVLFLLGYADVELRAGVGGWWVLLFLFAAIWEVARWWKQLRNYMSESFSTDGEGVGGSGMLVWEVFAVAPPLIAGFFLVFDFLFPNQWAFVAF